MLISRRSSLINFQNWTRAWPQSSRWHKGTRALDQLSKKGFQIDGSLQNRVMEMESCVLKRLSWIGQMIWCMPMCYGMMMVTVKLGHLSLVNPLRRKKQFIPSKTRYTVYTVFCMWNKLSEEDGENRTSQAVRECRLITITSQTWKKYQVQGVARVSDAKNSWRHATSDTQETG